MKDLILEYYQDEPIALKVSEVNINKQLRKLMKHISKSKTFTYVNVKDYIDIEEDYYIATRNLKAASVKEHVEKTIEEPGIKLPPKSPKKGKTKC